MNLRHHFDEDYLLHEERQSIRWQGPLTLLILLVMIGLFGYRFFFGRTPFEEAEAQATMRPLARTDDPALMRQLAGRWQLDRPGTLALLPATEHARLHQDPHWSREALTLNADHIALYDGGERRVERCWIHRDRLRYTEEAHIDQIVGDDPEPEPAFPCEAILSWGLRERLYHSARLRLLDPQTLLIAWAGTHWFRFRRLDLPPYPPAAP